jgi:hypothetical protein
MTWWYLLGVILVTGVLIYLVRTYAAKFIDPGVLMIFYVVAIVLLILFVLSAFGLLPLANQSVPRVGK